MRRAAFLIQAMGYVLFLLAGRPVAGAPVLRQQVDQHGDFLLIGNTLGQDCGVGTPSPVVGTVGNCGGYTSTPDLAPDVFWRADSPANGQAEAHVGITVSQARSTAFLSLPSGATVTHAYLSWGATLGAPGAPDTSVMLKTPGAVIETVPALTSYSGSNNAYQSVADITALVQQNGSGPYRVSDVAAASVVNVDNESLFAGWWLVVFYQKDSEPLRNLALYDALDFVADGSPLNTAVSVPGDGYSGRLGVVTFEGDNGISGDALCFNGGAALSDALNPADNFFNSTRSSLGSAVSVTGDLPQLTGTAQSLSGVDIDIVDVTAKLTPGLTSAPIALSSTGDTYHLAGLITSISAAKPIFRTSSKAASDLNGGQVNPGDGVKYTVVATNSGNDSSVDTVATDPLPPGVAFVPGSIQIATGPNIGLKTDAAGDDQCEYSDGTRMVTCRLGDGASSTQGGQLEVGLSTSMAFQLAVDAGASGTISNQATITAAGLQGAPLADTPSDGDANAPGPQTTDITVILLPTPTATPTPTPTATAIASAPVILGMLADGQTEVSFGNALPPACLVEIYSLTTDSGLGTQLSDAQGAGLVQLSRPLAGLEEIVGINRSAGLMGPARMVEPPSSPTPSPTPMRVPAPPADGAYPWLGGVAVCMLALSRRGAGRRSARKP